MGRGTAIAITAAVLLAAGLIGVGWLAAPDSGHAGEAPSVAGAAGEPDALREQIARLELRLAVEADARAQLAERVEALESLLGESGEQLARAEPEPRARRGDEESERETVREARRAARHRAVGGGQGFGPSANFDREKLVAAGFRPERVDAFKRRLDAIELDRLYLRDQALREEWIDSPQYREQRREFGEQLGETRREFGDDLYDWSLWTSGNPNRVQIGDVIQGSAAEAAGIESGDLLLSYAGERIFTPWELRRGTSDGAPGESVPIEIERAGERLRVYAPRGPLGVRTGHAREQPPAVR